MTLLMTTGSLTIAAGAVIFLVITLILVGALLLMLPLASAEGCVTPFPKTLFTATVRKCRPEGKWRKRY